MNKRVRTFLILALSLLATTIQAQVNPDTTAVQPAIMDELGDSIFMDESLMLDTISFEKKIKNDKNLNNDLNDGLKKAGYDVTRLENGKKLVLIIGDPRCVRYMIDNNCSDERCTGLRQRLSSQSSYTVFDM